MSSVLLIGPGSGLAKALGTLMTKKGFKVYGCFRKLPSLSDVEYLEQFSFEEILKDEFEFKFDLVINCANYRNWSDKDIANHFTNVIPGLLMEKLSLSGSKIINFGTYLQFLDVPKTASLYHYSLAKKQLSEKIQTLPNCVEFVLYTLYGKGDQPSSMMNQLFTSIYDGTPIDFSPGNQLIALTRIQDVANLTAKYVSETTLSGFSQYSLWPTPPISIRDVVFILENQVGLEPKIRWGAKNYAGHEIFEYSSDDFPGQYDSTNWTNLGLGLSATYNEIQFKK